MQAISKTVRIRHIQLVKIITLYITYTVDKMLREMYNEKVNIVIPLLETLILIICIII
jgi:hypothetical protein